MDQLIRLAEANQPAEEENVLSPTRRSEITINPNSQCLCCLNQSVANPLPYFCQIFVN